MINKNKYIINNNSKIHTFDAYYKNVILLGDTMIVPYINLSIFPEKERTEIKYIDRCYVLINGIKKLNLYRLGNVINLSTSNEYNVLLGGCNLDEDSIFVDMDILCDKGTIHLLEDSETSNEFFIPIDTPNFKMNMNPQKVEDFFNYKNCKLLL